MFGKFRYSRTYERNALTPFAWLTLALILAVWSASGQQWFYLFLNVVFGALWLADGLQGLKFWRQSKPGPVVTVHPEPTPKHDMFVGPPTPRVTWGTGAATDTSLVTALADQTVAIPVLPAFVIKPEEPDEVPEDDTPGTVMQPIPAPPFADTWWQSHSSMKRVQRVDLPEEDTHDES